MRKFFLLLAATLFFLVSFSQAQPKLPGNSKIIYFGDSQTSFGYGSGVNTVQFQNYGYIAWVNALSPGVYMPKGGMMGVAGETTSMMLNRLSSATALGARVMVVMAGTNDPLYGITPATTQANLRKIFNAAMAAGMRVIVVTIMPRFSPNAYNATNESNRRLINAWMKSQTDVTVIDVENDLNDPIYFIDGLHNSPLGAYIVGSKIAAEINKIVATCEPGSATEAQLSVASGTNPLMTGNLGKKDNATGTVATSWQLAGKFAGGAVVSGSKEVDATGREKQVINISGNYVSTVNSNGNLSTPKATFINNVSSPIALAAGDVVEGVAEVEITEPMTSVSHIYLHVQGSSADFVNTLAQGCSMWPTSSKVNYMPPGKYVLRTPPMTVAGSNTVGQLATQIVVELIPTSTKNPVSANIKITSVGVLKLPLADGPLSTVTPSGTQGACAGVPVQLNAATGDGYTYQWYQDGNKLKDSTSPTFYARDLATYTVTVKTLGCVVTSDATVLVSGSDCPPTGIQTATLPATLCAGQKLTVPFSTTGPFNAGNTFTAQLSDGQGSFANPTSIGTAIYGGAIAAKLPANLAPDAGYRIRVVCSSPAVVGADNGQNIRVILPPKAIISPAGVTPTYSNRPTTLTASPQGNYTYQWLSDGAAVAQSGNAPAIVATAAARYQVIVRSQEGCVDTSQATQVSLSSCGTITVSSTAVDTTQYSFVASGGIPPYQYALDNGNYQPQNTFLGFRSSRTYNLFVRDSVNCTAQLTFSTKAAQTISFNSLGNKLTTDAPFDLTASASSALPVNFRVVSGPATMAGNRLIINGSEGEVVIEASQGGDGSFYGAPPVLQKFLVLSISASRSNQAITFSSLPHKTFGAAPFFLGATASSGLPVTYRVVSGPASISGNLVAINGTGVVQIEASQIGNATYNPAVSVTQAFAVNPSSQTINFTAPANKTYGDAPFILIGSATSSLPVTYRIVSGPATVSGNNVIITGAGTVTIEATQAGNANFVAAQPVTQVFQVAKATQNISFATIGSKAFGDAPFSLTASTTSGLPLSFRILSGPAALNGTNVSLTGVGEVNIEASQPGDANYLAATAVMQAFSVAKGEQVITLDPIANRQYGDAPFPINASSSSGLAVGLSVLSGSATLSGNALSINGIGPVTIEATQVGNENYLPATAVRQTFTIAKASQVISFASLPNRTYGEAPFALSATASSGFPVGFRVVSGPASLSTNVVTLTGPGTVVVEASQPGDQYTVAAAPVQRAFVVNTAANTGKLVQTITFASLAYQTYGNPPFTLTATSSSGLPVSYRVVSGGISISGNTVSITGTGTAVIEAMQAGDATYNPATPVQRNFSIGKANQTITFTAPANKLYGDAPFALAATASSNLPLNYRLVSGPAILNGNTITATGTGNVTIEATQPGDANYNAAFAVQRTFTISKGNQAIDFPAISNKLNTDAPFILTATTTSNLPVTYRVVSGPASVANNVVTLLGIGNVTIEAAQAGDANYTAAVPVSRSFTIVAVQSAGSKFSQAITFDPVAAKTFGDAAFSLTATSSSGLPVSYQLLSGPGALLNNTVTIKGAGVITITASQPGDVNYNAAQPVTQNITVNKANQTINFSTISQKTYGDPAFALSATATSGLPVAYRVVSGPATIAGNLVSFTGIGWVTIEASQAGNANFNAANPTNQSFYVAASAGGKQAQVITFGTLPYKSFGSAPFDLSATASSGLPVIYRVVAGPVAISGATVTITGVGTATIEASQPGDASFAAATSVQRSFTIGKGGQTITFTAPTTKTYGDAPFALSATASSGLSVNYRIVSGPASVAGNVVTLTGTGPLAIEASQPGDANWNAAYSITRSISVVSPTAPLRSTTVTLNNKRTSETPAMTVKDQIIVYPNPASSNATAMITLAETTQGWLALYTAQGVLAQNFGMVTFLKNRVKRITINVEGVASGAYFLRLVTNNKVLVQSVNVLK